MAGEWSPAMSRSNSNMVASLCRVSGVCVASARIRDAALSVHHQRLRRSRSDAYRPSELMTPDEAERYHAIQIGTFSRTEADLVTAITMTHSADAIGVTRAAFEARLPVVISFTVETDGTLPSGEALGAAIRAVDDATASGPAYFMINYAHPAHFADTLRHGNGWVARIRGVRANAWMLSHAELDEAEELDTGDPADLAAHYEQLRKEFAQLTVLGGCCGTDDRHIEAIRRTCVPTFR